MEYWGECVELEFVAEKVGENVTYLIGFFIWIVFIFGRKEYAVKQWSCFSSINPYFEKNFVDDYYGDNSDISVFENCIMTVIGTFVGECDYQVLHCSSAAWIWIWLVLYVLFIITIEQWVLKYNGLDNMQLASLKSRSI